MSGKKLKVDAEVSETVGSLQGRSSQATQKFLKGTAVFLKIQVVFFFLIQHYCYKNKKKRLYCCIVL